MKKINLITGIADLLILSILKHRGDSYVYEICKFISSESKGYLAISHNTIYTAMYKLEEENLISEYSQLVGKKRTRVYYHIEPSGVEYLNALEDSYHKMHKGTSFLFHSLLSVEDEIDE